ncbi:MAG TPA: lamin tail domain-containing protein [Candidatus Saccharimonadales bacterium]|jgi:hypothetical protein
MARVVMIAVVVAIGLIASVVKAQSAANEIQPILIVEVQTASTASASEEFVEIYNYSDKLLDAEDISLKLQYKSATGTTWLTKASLSGELQPRGRYLIATKDFVDEADHESGLGLAASGGHLRVISEKAGIEHESDQMSWGSAESATIEPADPPSSGQSLKRLVDEDGNFVDSGNDNTDFFISDTPSPQSAKPLARITDNFTPSTGNLGQGGLVQSSSDGNSGRASVSLKISELFIDPDKPLTDADDEFVEIFNPTKEAVDLEDYVIKTGTSFSYSFTLPPISIASGQYLALFSIDTGLVLSNSGGTARLIGPDSKIVYEVPAYSKAKTNTSWADIDRKWQWTDLPTPNTANKTSGGEDGDNLLASASGAGGIEASSSNGRTIYEEPPASESEVNTAVVAGVGSLALLYVGYEYRYDFGNRIHQLRRYLASRRGGGQET